MKKTELICGIAAFILLIAGIAMALRVYFTYQKGRETYDDMEAAFTSDNPGEKSEDTESATGDGTGSETDDMEKDSISETGSESLPEDAPERITVDWGALSASYDDCVAWIQIPAVEISYPVMQAEDNDYYLHRSPDGSYIYAGSIFMDYQNDSYLEDFNTIIYGHNMRDGSMFAKLKQFKDSEVLVFCPYFWIYTPDRDYLYRIFSVHSVNADGNAYALEFDGYEGYTEWFYEMLDTSEIDTGITALVGKKAVTLSTCNGNSATRLVVQGVLVWQDVESEDD